MSNALAYCVKGQIYPTKCFIAEGAENCYLISSHVDEDFGSDLIIIMVNNNKYPLQSATVLGVGVGVHQTSLKTLNIQTMGKNG